MDDGFRRGNDGNLYRYFSTPKTWKDAKQHCESQKAVLAVSKTNETRMYMRQMFPNNFWIGLSNHSVDNMWKWADGKDMVNTNWDPKMKKAAKGLGCAHMVEEGKWNQSSCEMKKPFLCQRAGKYYLVRGHIQCLVRVHIFRFLCTCIFNILAASPSQGEGINKHGLSENLDNRGKGLKPGILLNLA